MTLRVTSLSASLLRIDEAEPAVVLCAGETAVFLQELRPTARKDARFYCGRRLALVGGDSAVVLESEWQEGERDFCDYATWQVRVHPRWSPDATWVRHEALDCGRVHELQMVDEEVVGAFLHAPVVFTRALLLLGERATLSIASDMTAWSCLDVSVSPIAVREYLDLACDVRRLRSPSALRA